MDSPGSDMVSEGADSSSIGHGPGDLHDGRVKSIGSGPISAPLTITSIGDSDSSSDISMSPETDDEEGQSQNIIRVNESSQPIRHPSISISNDEKQESRKRKHTGPAEDVTSNYIGIGLQPEVHKRRRPEDFARIGLPSSGASPKRDWSQLPPRVWQRVFMFCSPVSLGRLLQVNKKFNASLDPGSSLSVGQNISPIQDLKPDSSWQASRRLFRPDMPHPLSGKTELDMWKLAYTDTCQFCGKRNQPGAKVHSDLWHPGPGENGVSPVWLFAVRSCGSCLQAQSIKVCFRF